ncbi:E3 ubiquitin-protein ligase [Tripterygium wilfordii]|uniref:RING-type E3 ubiquitin transferase n=1 Tax=Tripterygium wilfordii TaxID=458696 RepID=A0A7J7CFU2_TRIWF|nr:E3 ubiquitin-protein ligase At4g11680-like [Tripterygium wilfordii]XP_038680662.1 E3 ubiquitin-protein ligase At4g11680-like [Tripterygium wilfordii]KAF5733011.1 E3 ubiquitin-protein ligase [Tripterygium wilfordii]
MHLPDNPPLQTDSSSSETLDTSPLLNHSLADHLLRSRRILRNSPRQFRGAAADLLRRAGERSMMLREPSVRVREFAAEQLEERQSDWAYSKPIVIIDVLWNLAFAGIAVTVLGLSAKEKTEVPLRVWIIGHALQCVFHIVCVVAEYRRRNQRRSIVGLEESGRWSSLSGSDADDYGAVQSGNEHETSVVKHLESANTMFSFIWWVIGFYWVSAGGPNVTSDSPQLYWLVITFLAFDVLFVVICVAVACLIGIAVCCCLPCIIGILYVMSDRDGATQEEIDRLPKYKFHRVCDFEKVDDDIQEPSGGIMAECGTDMPSKRILSEEDTECCICLSAYDDGTDLRELPCLHHFHCTCIDKWLHINATCPLCKFNILKSGNQSGSEEV